MTKFGLPTHAIEALQHVFQSYPNINNVILYGSRAKGNYRRGSDIDLCLHGPKLTITDLLHIESEIDDLLLPWKIDLSIMHLIDNPLLIKHIQSVGITLYQREVL